MRRSLVPRRAAALAGAVLLAACARGESREAAPPARGTTPSAGSPALGDTLPAAERARLSGTIAFVTERDGGPDVWLADPRTGAERPLARAAAAEYPAAAAPDGSALLVVTAHEDSAAPHTEQLWVHELRAGGPPRALGPRAGRVRSPSWSPDGRWVAFESDIASFRDVWRVARDGSAFTRLTDDPAGNFEPAVSPDGRSVAFVSSRDGEVELYAVGSDGTRERRLTAFPRDEMAPRWRPDGGLLAFVGDRSGAERVHLMRPDGRDQRALGGAPYAAGDAAVAERGVAWSPDGRSIAFAALRRGAPARVWVADVAAGTRRPVTPAGVSAEAPAWSPDGRHLAVTINRGEADADVYVVRADGTALTRLTSSPKPDWLPVWIR